MLNPMSLEGRVILITGAAQGIGRGVAQKQLSWAQKSYWWI